MLCATLLAVALPAFATPLPPVVTVVRHPPSGGPRVVVSADTSAPSVAIAVSFPYGTAHEPQREAGVAALTQHVVGLRPRAALEAVRSAGGNVSVERTAEVTSYVVQVPAPALAEGLTLAAAWLSAAPPTGAEVEAARAALRQIAGQPWRAGVEPALEERLVGLCLQGNWAFGHAPQRDLDTLAVDRVQAFARAHHLAAHAAVTVVGHVDPEPTRQRLVALLAAAPRDASRPAAPSTTLPPQRSPRAAHLADLPTYGPRVAWGFVVPGREHTSHAAVAVLAALLETPAGPLASRLVDRDELALRVAARSLELPGHDVLAIHAALPRGGAPAAVHEALTAELAGLALASPSAELLASAQRRVVQQRLRRLEPLAARAHRLGWHELMDGDAGAVNAWLHAALAVTPDAVSALARTELVAARRTTLEGSPAPALRRIYRSTSVAAGEDEPADETKVGTKTRTRRSPTPRATSRAPVKKAKPPARAPATKKTKAPATKSTRREPKRRATKQRGAGARAKRPPRTGPR